MFNILIIEDEKDLLEDMPPLLRTYGFEASSTNDFDRALTLLKEQAFDCVILDLKMPSGHDMSDEETENGRWTGILVIKRIRERYPLIPILVVTSLEDPFLHSLINSAGANDFIKKPCYFDNIVLKIKSLIKR